MLDCPHVHTLKRVNCFAMFDIIQRHWVELAGRPRETFAPQMSLDTVLYYPGWRNMAQLQDITRHQPEKNDDTHTLEYVFERFDNSGLYYAQFSRTFDVVLAASPESYNYIAHYVLNGKSWYMLRF